jgi:hypothetical protein
VYNIGLTGEKMFNIVSNKMIGTINMGIDGTDEYALLRVEGDVTIQELKNFLKDRYRCDSSYPGAWFCRGVTAMPKPYFNDEFVVIIHDRMDV